MLVRFAGRGFEDTSNEDDRRGLGDTSDGQRIVRATERGRESGNGLLAGGEAAACTTASSRGTELLWLGRRA